MHIYQPHKTLFPLLSFPFFFISHFSFPTFSTRIRIFWDLLPNFPSSLSRPSINWENWRQKSITPTQWEPILTHSLTLNLLLEIQVTFIEFPSTVIIFFFFFFFYFLCTSSSSSISSAISSSSLVYGFHAFVSDLVNYFQFFSNTLCLFILYNRL